MWQFQELSPIRDIVNNKLDRFGLKPAFLLPKEIQQAEKYTPK
jgi:hypothetical protein